MTIEMFLKIPKKITFHNDDNGITIDLITINFRNITAHIVFKNVYKLNGKRMKRPIKRRERKREENEMELKNDLII